MVQVETKESTAKNDTDYSEAISIIIDAISSHAEKLSNIAKSTEELDPVLLEGETSTGFYVRAFIDPKIAAKIFLKHGYSAYLALGLDAPRKMWDELAAVFGLELVLSIDL